MKGVEWMEGKGLRRWGGRVSLQEEQLVQGPKHILEAERHCGQSRVRPADRQKEGRLAGDERQGFLAPRAA